MNCVSPTPKEATACPTYLFIIQQTFIERMLYTGHCVKCVRDTKTTKFCFQVTEFNSIPKKPIFPTQTSLHLTKSIAGILKVRRRLAPKSLTPSEFSLFFSCRKMPGFEVKEQYSTRVG